MKISLVHLLVPYFGTPLSVLRFTDGEPIDQPIPMGPLPLPLLYDNVIPPRVSKRAGAVKSVIAEEAEPVNASTENFSLSPFSAPPPLGRLKAGFLPSDRVAGAAGLDGLLDGVTVIQNSRNRSDEASHGGLKL